MKSQHKLPKPPRTATAFLEWYCSEEFLEEVQGDLKELFLTRLDDIGPKRAKFLYWLDILHFFRPYLFRKKLFHLRPGGTIMFKNYFKVALRNMLKFKVYSVINISGLVIGLATCILILLYVQDELSYDKFHVNADRIYRVTSGELREDSFRHLAYNYPPAAPALLNDFPDIEEAVRLLPLSVAVERNAENRFQEDKFVFVDSTFFEVFSFTLKHGNPKTVLDSPDGLVLTEEAAQKYFGQDNPLGQILRVEGKYDFKVSGVLEELPANSHFHFDFLAPITSLQNIKGWTLRSWFWPETYTYVLLPPNYSLDTIESQFPNFIAKHIGSWAPQKRKLYLQPLTDIRLHSNLESEIEPTGNIAYVYIFLTIAFFILLIACINFMNLATARSVNRAKEIGLRKVIGAQRSQLVNQFLGEAMFYAFLSFILAIGIVEFVLPYFNQFVNKQLDIKYLENWRVLLGFVTLTFFVGLLSGSYPAAFLSKFRPVKALQGNAFTGKRGAGHLRFRSILVVLQFAISIGLIIIATVIKDQLSYIKNRNPGFGKDQILVIPVRDDALQNNLAAFKNRLIENTNILGVTATSTIPGIERNVSFPIKAEGFSEDSDINFHNMLVDHDFIRTFQMEIIEGRDFAKTFTADTSGSFILNETAAATLGWDLPLNKRISMHAVDSGQDKKGRVIGIVKDFHYRSLHYKIAPLVLLVSPQAYYLDNIAVRVHPQNVSEALAFLEEKWQEILPHRPFVYTFLDEYFEQMYQKEQKMGEMFNYFSVLAIFVGCLGLFGLASYTAEQRTKEIGIRKVLGASVPKIIMMLSKELVMLVGIAFLIAGPIAYYLMEQWLQEFVYKIDLKLLTFVLSGMLALVIALLTISYQAMKAALVNPVDALRHE